jgi:hypothetical protein
LQWSATTALRRTLRRDAKMFAMPLRHCGYWMPLMIASSTLKRGSDTGHLSRIMIRNAD